MKRMRRLLPALALSCLAISADCQTNAFVATAPPARRPRIGVALGGGGALGIAHVGVLRKLEEMRVPVDCIAGTSMGAIIAGLYASGMSPDAIDKLLVGIDWWDVLRDQTSYRDLDFRRKEDSSRYLMDLELGLRNFRFMFPFGLASGQKFNNILQSVTINSAGATSFDALNIPFRAVATDLRTGQAVVLDHGNLAVAMRASMAVPGAFTPVTIEGKLLVDGGLANNIPVDVVKAMGADVVIAVDVGASEYKAGQKSKFESLSEILSQSYSIMQRPKDDARRRAATILIEPDLVGWSASEFHRSAELIPRGMAAAAAHSNELDRLSISATDYAAWNRNQREQSRPSMILRSVEIVGNRTVPSVAIMKRVKSRAGDKVDFESLSKDVARVHGMGDFQSVTHRLVPTDTPGEYDLKIDTVEKYWGPHYIHCGLRLESDMKGDSSYSMLVNLRQANRNDLGGESRLDLEIGRQQRALWEWYQPLQNRGFLFVAPAAEVKSESQDLYREGDRVAEYKRDLYGGRFDIGTQMKQYGEFRSGVFSGQMRARTATGEKNLPSVDAQLGAFTAQLTFDRLDARVFPRRGWYLGVNAYFSKEILGADDEYSKVEGRLQGFKSRGNHTLGGEFRCGDALDSDVPVYDQYAIGGLPTIPGLAPGELRGSYYDVARVTYRYRFGRLSPSMGKDIYAIGTVSAGNVWQESSEIDASDLIVGTLIGLAADTIVGPVAIGMGQAEEGARQLYVSVGTVF